MANSKKLSSEWQAWLSKFDLWAFIFPGFYLLWGRCYLSYLLLMIGSFLGPLGIMVRIYVGYHAREWAFNNSARTIEDFYTKRSTFTTSLLQLLVVLGFIGIATAGYYA